MHFFFTLVLYKFVNYMCGYKYVCITISIFIIIVVTVSVRMYDCDSVSDVYLLNISIV